MNNRDEILEKSRNENKGKDLFEMEVKVKAGFWGIWAAVILASIFYTVQIVVGEGTNNGLIAVVFSIAAIEYIIRAIRLKRKNEITAAVILTLGTFMFSIIHISELIASSSII